MVTKQDAVCTDCDPPRRFKSIPGLNGHMQFKHSKMPPTRHMNGRQARMYEEMSDRLDQVLGQQEEILDLLRANEAIGVSSGRRNGNGNGQGNGNGNGQANGNGNGQGNGNGNGQANGNGQDQANGNGQDQGNGIDLANGNDQDGDRPNYVCNDCKGNLNFRQKHCRQCGEEIDWSGVPSNGE